MKIRKAIEKSGGIKELLVAFLIGAWMLYQFISSFSMPQSNFDSLGSSGYARMVSGLGLFFIALYLIQKVLEIVTQYRSLTAEELRTDSGEKDSGEEEEKKPGPIAWMRRHYKLSMLGLCIVYVLLIDRIGFVIASALYLLASMFLYSAREKRNIFVILALTLLFSVGIYLIFRYGFTIILP